MVLQTAKTYFHSIKYVFRYSISSHDNSNVCADIMDANERAFASVFYANRRIFFFFGLLYVCVRVRAWA